MDMLLTRVLLIDDDEDDYVMTRDLLDDTEHSAFTLDWVDTYDDALRAIESSEHDVYLLDYRLRERDGLELLREARAGGCRTPMILLTGQGDREIDIEAMRAGAADYLVKGQIESPLLERSIRYCIQHQRSLDALQVAQERERQLQEHALAQEKHAAVGQLAAGIAHDFNNMLSGIMGHAELALLKPGIPESIRHDVRVILQQGSRAAQLIRQILDFSRKSIIDRRPLDLVPILKETVKLLRHSIPESVHIHLDTVVGNCVVQADPVQIQQLVTNLAVNARDAMPEGGELRISLTQTTYGSMQSKDFFELPAGNWVLLSVSDTGTGIPKHVTPHLFEPFFTTKQVGKGTGLGLAQAYGITKQHDGFIDVDTEVGKGSTFHVYLPVRETMLEQSDTDELHNPRGTGETILVVEDDRMVLAVTTSMLESLGYRVLPASNPQEALGLYDTHHASICLVLSDVVMPGIGGVGLYGALRESDPSLKFIFMSGYPIGDAEQELSGYDWIHKPVSLETLAQVVHLALGTQKDHQGCG